MKCFPPCLLPFALFASFAVTPAFAQDWLTWGRTPDRNMVAPQAKGVPIDFTAGKRKPGTDEIDLATAKGVKWVAKLGSQAYGNVAVSNGRIFLGTNNEVPRDPQHVGDRGVVYCLDEKTGELLWQLIVPKLGSGKVSDWEYLGICSSPTVDGDRVYVATNRCEILCLDVKGMANGNDGAFKDEAQYFVGPGNKPATVGPRDADILWRYDMREDLGVFPHNMTAGSPLIVGDRVYVSTGNGVDWGHTNIPNPKAPALVCLDKNTGEYLGEETSGLSERVLHGNWVSAAYGPVGDPGQKRSLVVFPGPDGYCYGFEPEPAKSSDNISVLRESFRFDCNPPEYRKDKDGNALKYATFNGPSEIISTPVIFGGKVYTAIGQDPEHGDGLGGVAAFDPSKTGDTSKTALIWQNKKVGRSMSTVSIADGLLYVGEFAGIVHCLDLETGKELWSHDTKGRMWGSTMVADGKVIVGNEDGILTILAHGKEKKLLKEIEFPTAIYSTPVIANQVLYISTQTHLYAVPCK